MFFVSKICFWAFYAFIVDRTVRLTGNGERDGEGNNTPNPLVTYSFVTLENATKRTRKGSLLCLAPFLLRSHTHRS